MKRNTTILRMRAARRGPSFVRGRASEGAGVVASSRDHLLPEGAT